MSNERTETYCLKAVHLTHDDIITLRLLREQLRRYVSPHRLSEEGRASKPLNAY